MQVTCCTASATKKQKLVLVPLAPACRGKAFAKTQRLSAASIFCSLCPALCTCEASAGYNLNPEQARPQKTCFPAAGGGGVLSSCLRRTLVSQQDSCNRLCIFGVGIAVSPDSQGISWLHQHPARLGNRCVQSNSTHKETFHSVKRFGMSTAPEPLNSHTTQEHPRAVQVLRLRWILPKWDV